MAKSKMHVSPQGTLAFAWIKAPDEEYGNKYKATLLLDKDGGENDAFVSKVNAVHDKARGKKTTPSPVKDGDTRDKEEFHGKWMVGFKSKFQPKLYDGKRNVIDPNGDECASSGDSVRVAFTLFEYSTGSMAGVSLQLAALQVIEKRANHGDSPFGEVDGGFEASGAVFGDSSSNDEDLGDDSIDF